MADTNIIKLGNNDLNFKVGSSDCKIYLGDILLYPKDVPPTPPSFDGKWIATYEGGTTSSAECGSSSAITQNEITLTNLVSVEIGDCVTSIGGGAFEGCTSLTNVTIPNSVTSIGNQAFYGCTSLTNVTIPNSVTSIGGDAFAYCYGLTNVTIPDSVTSIGGSAFAYCYGLSSVTIPDSVTSIGGYAFQNCTGLTSATIGSGITSIGNRAFDGCTSLTSVTVNAITPPTLGIYVFNNTDNPIYVPAASVNAYKAAKNWSTYASRIQAISEKIKL